MGKTTDITDRYYDSLKDTIYREVSERVEGSDVVLEVGCGDCALAMFLAREKGIEVIGIDKNGGKFAETVRQCREGFCKNVTCVEGDELILRMFREDTFPCVVIIYALHEFESPSRVLEECRRVMKNSGRIIVIDFIKGTAAEELWGEDYFTADEIKSIVTEAGFAVSDGKNISDEGPVLITGVKRR